jgi:hypothetical protein
MTSEIRPIPTLQARALQHFGTVVRSFLACDAVMLLFLTFGYITPGRGHVDPAGQLMAAEPAPANFGSDAVKTSPFLVRKWETRAYGRQPDVVYTRAQEVPVRMPEKPIVTDSPVKDVSTEPVRTTAVALPLGIS